jgi:galactose oxidase-like protein
MLAVVPNNDSKSLRCIGAVLLACGLTLVPAGLSASSGRDTVAQSEPGDGTFRRVATTGSGPSPRGAAAVAAVGDDVYVFGGVLDDFAGGTTTFYDDLYRLDTGSSDWQAVRPDGESPPGRAFAAVAAESGLMFVFGGATFSLDGSEFAPFGDLWSFDPRTSRWESLPTDTGPGARSGAAMWAHDGELFVFGGLDATFTAHGDLWSYDLSTGRWQQLVGDGDPAAPLPRHAALTGQVAPGGVLTLYGGEGVDMLAGFAMMADTWQYDHVAGSCRQVHPSADLDPPHNDGAAAVIDGALYLHGGDIDGGSSGCGAPFPQNPTDHLWRFDPAAGSWDEMHPGGELPPALKRHAAAVVDHTLYIVAGFDFQCADDDDPGQLWNTDVYAYTPER